MPDAGQTLGRAVEDDAAADEDEPLDEALDRAELVRDVEDGDSELAVQAVEQAARAPPAASASTPVVGSSRTSSDGWPASAFAMKARCCWPPESVRSGTSALSASPTRSIASATMARSRRRSGPSRPPDGEPACGDDLAHGRGRVDPELRALGEVAERGAAREPRRRLAEEERVARRRPLEPERQPHQRRLAAAVRAGDRDELPGLDGEVTCSSTGCRRCRRTRRRAARPLRGMPSAFRSAARFSRMTEK